MRSVEIWSDKASYQVYGTHKKIETILLFKIDHVGDFILSFDALLVIRSRFPDAKLVLVCAPWNRVLAQSLDLFTDIITIELFDVRADNGRRELTDEIIQRLPKQHFDLAVDLR